MNHIEKMRAAYNRLEAISSDRHALNVEEQRIRDSICDALGVEIGKPATDSRTGDVVMVTRRHGEFFDHANEDGSVLAMVRITGRPKTKAGFHTRNWGYANVADPAGWIDL